MGVKKTWHMEELKQQGDVRRVMPLVCGFGTEILNSKEADQALSQ